MPQIGNRYDVVAVVLLREEVADAYYWDDAVNAWSGRQVGRRQVSSIALAGGHVCVDMARSLRATIGSTNHRYHCSHCTRQQRKTHATAAIVKKGFVTKRIVKKQVISSHSGSCSRDEAKPPASVRPGDSREEKMRPPPRAPTSSHRRPIGASWSGL